MNRISNAFGVKLFDKTPRSVHNLTNRRAVTTHPGQARPFYFRTVYPADKFKISPDIFVHTFPTVLPFMGAFDCRIDYFFVPFSLWYGWLDNDTQLTFDQFLNYPRLRWDIPRFKDNPMAPIPGVAKDHYGLGSLWDHSGHSVRFQGYHGSGVNPGNPDPAGENPLSVGGPMFNCDSMLAYLAVYRHFYANPQEPYFVESFTSAAPGDGTLVPAYKHAKHSLKALDYLFPLLRQMSTSGEALIGQIAGDGLNLGLDSDLDKYFPVPTQGHIPTNGMAAYVGVFLRDLNSRANLMDCGILSTTYEFDYFRGRINSSRTKEQVVTSTDGTITVNNIRFANKIQKWADKFNITSGRPSDWLRALWPARVKSGHKPEYLGGVSSTIQFQSIFQNSETAQTPLGWEVNVGRGSFKGRNIYFRSDTYGILVGILNIRPKVYYENIAWKEDLYQKFGDMYNPEMANLGYEELPGYELSTDPMVDPNSKLRKTYDLTSIGSHLAWIEAMTDVDRAYGQFHSGTLLDGFLPLYKNRPPEDGDAEKTEHPFLNYSTYINPADWNKLFADNSAACHNFHAVIYQNIKATRAIPYRTMPSL